MALAPDDPAHTRYAELKANGATREQIVQEMEVYEVSATLLIKALSPGHAKAAMSGLANHMVEGHLDPGMGAVSRIGDAVEQKWLDGPLFGGELNG